MIFYLYYEFYILDNILKCFFFCYFDILYLIMFFYVLFELFHQNFFLFFLFHIYNLLLLFQHFVYLLNYYKKSFYINKYNIFYDYKKNYEYIYLIHGNNHILIMDLNLMLDFPSFNLNI